MKACCMRSFAVKGLREGFRAAVENEGHTCGACGQQFRLIGGKWHATEGGADTINVFDPDAAELDFGWAQARRDRARGVIVVQCWGCGGVTELPDRPFVEAHFDHATRNCSVQLAERNRKRGVMPKVRGH